MHARKRAPNHSQRSTTQELELHFWLRDGTGQSHVDPPCGSRRALPTGVVFLRACAPKRDPRRWVAYTPIPASVLSL
jgi:hypothetical protein